MMTAGDAEDASPQQSWTSLVDPASSRMLVSKIKSARCSGCVLMLMVRFVINLVIIIIAVISTSFYTVHFNCDVRHHW